MSHRGGWSVVEHSEEPIDQPDPADVPPGRWRCCRRRNGRIDVDGVVWTVEHPDAAERYERERREERRAVREDEDEQREDGDEDEGRHRELALEAIERYADGEIDAEEARLLTDMAVAFENPTAWLEDR